ncbi:MAG: HD domain-containing protein, partial [Desulfobacteraceae bacterium]|nr:HD domain-containing protein [Desulfobacteraceae bacterium]
MKTANLHVTLWDLVGPLARTFDLMSPALAEHSLRVAYLALRLAEEMELDADACREVCLAGALHDIGAFSLYERLDLLAFEETRPMQHAEAGYLLLREFAPFREVAGMVRFHHLAWDHGAGETHEGRPVPRGSHLLHLADRVAV